MNQRPRTSGKVDIDKVLLTALGDLIYSKNAQEFKLMVQAGMSPAAASRAATLDATTLLGRADTIGTIEPGEDADFIAVAASPLDDVTELERVRFVMLAAWFTSSTAIAKLP